MAASVELHTGFYITALSATLQLFPDGSQTAVVSPPSVSIPTTEPGVFTFSNPTLTGLHKAYLTIPTAANPSPTLPAWSGWVNLATSGLIVSEDSRVNALGRVISIVVADEELDQTPVPGQITCLRGDTLNETLTLGTLAGWTKIVFTAKTNPATDTDAQAILQVVVTSNNVGSGLTQNNGTTITANSTLGSLTVADETLGTVYLAIDASVTAQLSNQLFWDCQVQKTTANIKTPAKGPFKVNLDVTQSVA